MAHARTHEPRTARAPRGRPHAPHPTPTWRRAPAPPPKPPTTPLTLPNLTLIPHRITPSDAHASAAQLLLALERLGVRPARYPRGATPNDLLRDLIHERLTRAGDTRLALCAHATLNAELERDYPLVVTLNSDTLATLDLDPLLDTLAQHHQQHASSLLAHLDRSLALLNPLTPNSALYLLSCTRWRGCEDDTEWLEELRYDYDLDEDTSLDEIRAITQREGLLGPEQARRVLRYASDEPPTSMPELVRHHPSLATLARALADDTHVARWRERCFAGFDTLRDAHDDQLEPSFPIALLAGGRDAHALMHEALNESEQLTLEAGNEPLPLACAFLPDLTDASLREFLDTLDAISHLLAREERILRALDALAQQPPNPLGFTLEPRPKEERA